MSSFLKLNDGMPQLPIGGGYSLPPQLPSMRAPVPQTASAGVGPIAGGTMINRGAFLSHPPMGNRGPSGYDAIAADIIAGRIWLY